MRAMAIDPQEMQAPEDLRALAKNGISKIAASELKARGPRQEGGLLSDWAMRLFWEKSLEEIQEIAFEIGETRLEINNPQETRLLRALPCMAVKLQRRTCAASCGVFIKNKKTQPSSVCSSSRTKYL